MFRRRTSRAVSYRIDPYQMYAATEPDGVMRTKNFLIRTDRRLRFLDQREVVCDAAPLREDPVRGLEDARLFSRRGDLGFTCVTTEHHPAGRVRIALASIGDGGSGVRPVALSGFGDDRPQKNWLPFTDPATGDLLAVYGFDPLVVLQIACPMLVEDSPVALPGPGAVEPRRRAAEDTSLIVSAK